MITSAKNYTKKTHKHTKTDRQNPGQMVKQSYKRKSHKEAYTYTLTKREKEKNIYLYKIKKEESNQIYKQIYQ